MADTGWIIAGKGSQLMDGIGGGEWVDVNALATETDTNYAKTGGGASLLFRPLAASSFGLNIPQSAVVLGLQVRVRSRKTDSESGTLEELSLINIDYNDNTGSEDNPIYMHSTVGVIKNVKHGISTVFTNFDAGGSGDLWGSSNINPALVNQPSFGVRANFIKAKGTGVQVPSIWMRVFFEVNSTVFVQDGNVWKEGRPYVNDGGVWKPSTHFVKDAGVWKT